MLAFYSSAPQITRALILGVILLSSATSYGQIREWLAPFDGGFADPSNWDTTNVPDTVSEIARFDLFGSYDVEFADGASQLVGDFQLLQGQVRMHGLGLNDPTLQVANNALVSTGDLLLDRNLDPGDLQLQVTGSLTVESGGSIEVLDDASVTASSTAIGVGTNSTNTEIFLDEGASANLGALSIGLSGSGTREALLSIVDFSHVTADSLDLATTNATNREGVVELVNQATMSINSGGVATIGNDQDAGLALVALVSGSQFSADIVNVRSSGSYRNISGHAHFETTLTINGGSYQETLASATRSFGTNASIVVEAGGQMLLNASPLTLNTGQSLQLNQATFTASSPTTFSGASVNLVGLSTLDSDLNLTSGLISINSGADVQFAGAISHTGGVFSVESGATARLDGAYEGPGLSDTGTAVFSNSLAPGPGVATASFAGNVELTTTANLQIEVTGPTPSEVDHLNVAGIATLDGALTLSLPDLGSGSYVPQAGDSYSVITAGSISGSFSTISVPTLANGLRWGLESSSGSLTFRVLMPGDFNGDNQIDAIDFTIWRNSQGTTGSFLMADGNGNGIVDLADYTQWNNAYSSLLAPSISIPEPSCMALVLFSCCFCCYIRS